MNKGKILISLILSIVLLLGVVACGRTDESKQTERDTKTAGESASTGVESSQQPTESATDAKPNASSQTGGKRLKIVTSIYPMYEFTKRLVGDDADVVNMIPAGQEPHDWEPTPADLVKLQEADLFVYNGAGMEFWVDDILKSIDQSKLKVVEASHGLKLLASTHHHDSDHEHAHDHEGDKHEHESDEHKHEHESDEHKHEHESDEHKHEHESDEHKHEHGSDEHKHEHGSDEHKHEHGSDEHKHEHESDEHEHAHESDKHEHEHDEHGHAHGEFDPHVWLSPTLAEQQAQAIAQALIELNPEAKDTYTERMAQLSKDFAELDHAFKQELNDLKSRIIVVNHEAFAYLCHAYNLEQMGITGINADHEPSPAKMAEIIDFVTKHQVKTIFAEELLSPKVAEAIAQATGANVELLNPIEGLTQEQLDRGEDYFSMMKQNLANLVKALK